MADSSKNSVTCTIHEDSVRYAYDGTSLHVQWDETRDGERQTFGRSVAKSSLPAAAQTNLDSLRAAIYTRIKNLRSYP